MKLNLDPRPFAVSGRLKNIKKIFAVSGFKGGVGKTAVSCLLALSLAEKGHKTGLLDLDFSGASCHTVLGAEPGPEKFFPQEIDGLLPPEISGVKFMSLAFFTQDRAAHLRGADIANAVLELLAVTNWAETETLILDMPPGISDAALEIMRFIPRAEIVCVVTPSGLSRALAARALKFTAGAGIKIAGVIENFSDGKTASFEGYKILSALPYDKNFEKSLGNISLLKSTEVYKKSAQIPLP